LVSGWFIVYRSIFQGKVIVTRGFTREGKFLKIGIKIINNTGTPCRDVSVRITYPEAFEIEQSILSGKNYLNLGDIEANSFNQQLYD
jgi:hypothetical protein